MTTKYIKAQSKANSIQCTSCRAPLEIFGNQARSKALVCGYCGNVMDCKNEFRSLYVFTKVQKPSSDLRIGMSLTIAKVEFVISAYIVYEALQGGVGEWIEYQLYSPNYGYALLIFKDDACYFLRKTYHLPKPNIWLLRAGDYFSAKQTHYTIEQFYLTRIIYSEGMLLENIKRDKREKQCFASVDNYCYYSKYNLNKVNYYQGYKVDKSQLLVRALSVV